ncbi:YciI family protein [Cellulomonas edaphi]|uniref:YciI family protein n=1 Tax=Cellulomonas edaphi TaxID=3053468 RepID=A0ABT7S2S7_9CELL|nr:YciI family protein [Cellulomons edaphi]MDM7829920.1 YciI family protein [Cellulomons edaphi]
MAKYLLIVDFQSGPDDAPMSAWTEQEVADHLSYYGRLNRSLEETGELLSTTILTGPDLAKVVTSDGTTTVVTDGPFPEFKEWVAGYQIVDVASEERALEIAGLVSAVPGRGGVPTQQPIQVRRVMDDGPSDPDEMAAFLESASGTP